MKRYQPGRYCRRFWDGLRSVAKQPFTVRRYRYSTQVIDASGKVVASLCLRGNSKQRRQQVRLALRYLNAPVEMIYQGDPRQLPPFLLPHQSAFLLGHVVGPLIIDGKPMPGFDNAKLEVIHTGAGGAEGDFPTLSGDVVRLCGVVIDEVEWQENLDPHSRFKK